MSPCSGATLLADGWPGLWEFLAAHYGNIASIVGLLVTLYTLWKVRQVREATRLAVRVTLAQVTAHQFRQDVSECLRLVRETREACRARQWPRAIDKCEEARIRLRDLRNNNLLGQDEAAPIASAVDDLSLIEQYLASLARPGARRTELSAPKMTKLGDIISLLSAIAGRLRTPLPEG